MLAAIWSGSSLTEIIILAIIIAGVIAVFFIATKAMGVSIPPWAVQIFWVVVIVFVAIAAIRLLMSM